MGVNCLVFVGLFFALFATVFTLQCYQCGQYNDGVGSITPCINETYMRLKDCPSRDHAYCIKYISEASIVKDCVAKCTDRVSIREDGTAEIKLKGNCPSRAYLIPGDKPVPTFSLNVKKKSSPPQTFSPCA